MQLQMCTAPACRAHEADVADVRSCRVPFEPGEDGDLPLRSHFGTPMQLELMFVFGCCGAEVIAAIPTLPQPCAAVPCASLRLDRHLKSLMFAVQSTTRTC